MGVKLFLSNRNKVKKYHDYIPANNINEAFLDAEQTIYDFKTAKITDENDVVDTQKTGTSYYDDFLNPSDLKYMQNKRNLTGKIEYMSCQEYYNRCAKIFNTTSDQLKRQRNHDRPLIDKLTKIMTEYKTKMCLPFINYEANGQEGLHRAMAIAELKGWDFKIPVLIVTVFDEQRYQMEQDAKAKQRIENFVEKAIDNCLYYVYNKDNVVEEFSHQLDWELEKVFEYEETQPTFPEMIDVVEETPICLIYHIPSIDYYARVDKEYIKVSD